MRHDPSFISLPVSESLVRLGDRLRRARKARKKSLVEMERICRIHRTTLARLERGEPGVSIGVFLSVLEALGELAELELVLTQPETPMHRRGVPVPALERDF